MRKLFALFSLLVVASMVLAACGGSRCPGYAGPVQHRWSKPPRRLLQLTARYHGARPMPSKDPTTLLSRPTFGDPDTLDPALDYETAGGEIVQNIYETLVFYNGKSHR